MYIFIYILATLLKFKRHSSFSLSLCDHSGVSTLNWVPGQRRTIHPEVLFLGEAHLVCIRGQKFRNKPLRWYGVFGFITWRYCYCSCILYLHFMRSIHSSFCVHPSKFTKFTRLNDSTLSHLMFRSCWNKAVRSPIFLALQRAIGRIQESKL